MFGIGIGAIFVGLGLLVYLLARADAIERVSIAKANAIRFKAEAEVEATERESLAFIAEERRTGDAMRNSYPGLAGGNVYHNVPTSIRKEQPSSPLYGGAGSTPDCFQDQ